MPATPSKPTLDMLVASKPLQALDRPAKDAPGTSDHTAPVTEIHVDCSPSAAATPSCASCKHGATHASQCERGTHERNEQHSAPRPQKIETLSPYLRTGDAFAVLVQLLRTCCGHGGEGSRVQGRQGACWKTGACRADGAERLRWYVLPHNAGVTDALGGKPCSSGGCHGGKLGQANRTAHEAGTKWVNGVGSGTTPAHPHRTHTQRSITTKVVTYL